MLSEANTVSAIIISLLERYCVCLLWNGSQCWIGDGTGIYKVLSDDISLP